MIFFKVQSFVKDYKSADDVREIIKELEKNKSTIKIVDLSDNNYYPEAFKAIMNTIKGLNRLETIKVDSICGGLDKDMITENIKSLYESVVGRIKSIDLNSNALSANFPEELCKLIEDSPIEHLDLRNCGLGNDGIERIEKCLINKKKLSYLSLAKNGANYFSESFGETISKLTNLKTLNLGSNYIQTDMSFLFDLFSKLNLKSLDISGFMIDDDIKLKEYIHSSTLDSLAARDIKSSDSEVIYKLLEFLSSKPEVKYMPGSLQDKEELYLDISFNYLSDEEEGRAYNNLIKVAKRYSLTKLLIYGCDIIDEREDFSELKSLIKGELVLEKPKPVDLKDVTSLAKDVKELL
ncbi:hypothetical protein A0H76_2721 [Hepatospora eriocheir]|uniref:Ran GTPase-activating protein (RanGAP) involved in mRNA processing and transport n=1 Tax=Hepatospora eriocheir TaxID=1081669 RepID=A0A1X0QJG2_9MICR|nr:hypothetical protein A0H76_2721 [Hepatospora eriocheir]